MKNLTHILNVKEAVGRIRLMNLFMSINIHQRGLILFKMRLAIEFIKKAMGTSQDGLVGIEIGVYKGENSKNIIKNLLIKRLYLIDPYEKYKEYDYPVESIKTYNQYREVESLAHSTLFEYKDRVVWIKKKSDDAVEDIPEDLDFVYIDGNHSYDYIKRDIVNYYPKLRKGGVLAGHDWWIEDVRSAVTEFAGNNGLKVNHYKLKETEEWNEKSIGKDRFDWWLVKNGN